MVKPVGKSVNSTSGGRLPDIGGRIVMRRGLANHAVDIAANGLTAVGWLLMLPGCFIAGLGQWIGFKAAHQLNGNDVPAAGHDESLCHGRSIVR